MYQTRRTLLVCQASPGTGTLLKVLRNMKLQVPGNQDAVFVCHGVSSTRPCDTHRTAPPQHECKLHSVILPNKLLLHLRSVTTGMYQFSGVCRTLQGSSCRRVPLGEFHCATPRTASRYHLLRITDGAYKPRVGSTTDRP